MCPTKTPSAASQPLTSLPCLAHNGAHQFCLTSKHVGCIGQLLTLLRCRFGGNPTSARERLEGSRGGRGDSGGMLPMPSKLLDMGRQGAKLTDLGGSWEVVSKGEVTCGKLPQVTRNRLLLSRGAVGSAMRAGMDAADDMLLAGWLAGLQVAY